MGFVRTEIFQTSKNSGADLPAKQLISLLLKMCFLCVAVILLLANM